MDKEREEELAYELEILSSDSDEALVLSDVDEAIEENRQLEKQQFHDAVENQAVEHGSDSDFFPAASPIPMQSRRKKAKAGKQTQRKLELVEEEKEEPNIRSSVRTRSALKARRNDAHSVTSQLAATQLGGGDAIMDDF